MGLALEQAHKARELGEVPVGAVAVRNQTLIATGHNQRRDHQDLLGHAEMIVMRRAARKLGDWRLEGVTLYVTLEPCPMCSGTMLQARVETLYFGADNRREGCAGSLVNLVDYPGMAHQIRVYGGLMAQQCGQILEEFFQHKRRGG
ncbi:MAG: tRNA adenosine(34) deaminase TadA [Vulcanimicrobiota bacterium]